MKFRVNMGPDRHRPGLFYRAPDEPYVVINLGAEWEPCTRFLALEHQIVARVTGQLHNTHNTANTSHHLHYVRYALDKVSWVISDYNNS